MGTLNANTKLLSIQINILNNTFSVFLMLSLIKIICKKNSYALLHTGKIGETFFLLAWKTLQPYKERAVYVFELVPNPKCNFVQ